MNEFTIHHAHSGCVEVSIEDYIVDVLLKPNIVIEVYHTHALDAIKWNILNKKYDVIEVRAHDVLHAIGTTGIVACQRLWRQRCRHCLEKASSKCSFCCAMELKTTMQWVGTALCCSQCAIDLILCKNCGVMKSYKRDLCFSCAEPCNYCFQGVIDRCYEGYRYCKDCAPSLFVCIVCHAHVNWKAYACLSCQQRICALFPTSNDALKLFCLLRKWVLRSARRRRYTRGYHHHKTFVTLSRVIQMQFLLKLEPLEFWTKCRSTLQTDFGFMNNVYFNDQDRLKYLQVVSQCSRLKTKTQDEIVVMYKTGDEITRKIISYFLIAYSQKNPKAFV